MTIETNDVISGPFVGNGVATSFPRDFSIGASDHLVVLFDNVEQTSGFTVEDPLLPQGNVVFDVAPTSGVEIYFTRSTPNVQSTDYSSQGSVSPEQVERDFDYRTRVEQENARDLVRSMKVPIGQEGKAFPVLTGNRWLKTDDDGNIIDGGDASEIAAAQEYAERAEAALDELVEYAYSPEAFGAVGDGVADDTDAFEDMIAAAKVAQAHVAGTPNKKYKISRSLWIGKDDAAIGIRSFVGNGATIVNGGVNNAPMVDAVGMQNGLKVPVKGWRVENFNASVGIPTCAFLSARPKQSAGVKSSGNFVISENQVYGHFSVANIYNVQSESNTVRDNMLFNYHTSGHALCMVRHDYFKNSVCLEFDGAVGTFGVNGTLSKGTVSTPSGATAKVMRPAVDLGGGAGRVWLQVSSGTFGDNEVMTFSAGGTAVVNEPDGYDLIGIASPNTTLGIEEDSTASLQPIYSNYFNTVNATNDDAPLFISDWVDVSLFGSNNFNQANANALYGQTHFQADKTVNLALGTGVRYFERDSYHHATHRCSITFGDPVSGGGSYEFNLEPLHGTGAVTVMEARVQHIGNAAVAIANAYGVSVISDQGIDLRGCRMYNNSKVRNYDTTYGYVTADQQFEGIIEASDEVPLTLTMGDAVNGAIVTGNQTGFTSLPPRSSDTISGGAIVANRSLMLVGAEGGATTDDLTRIDLPSNTLANGQMIGLRALSGAQLIKVNPNVSGGNIQVTNGRDIYLNSVDYVFFVYEKVSQKWNYVGGGQIAEATNIGFTAMAGTALKTALAVYTENYSPYVGQTASAAYNQTQIQALMDVVQNLSSSHDALLDDHKLLSGRVKALEAALFGANIIAS